MLSTSAGYICIAVAFANCVAAVCCVHPTPFSVRQFTSIFILSSVTDNGPLVLLESETGRK